MVSYQAPTALPIGVQQVTLIYSDSASPARTFTNQWQFSTADRSILGYWKFNEKLPGQYVSTSLGSILDASGNLRHGTPNYTGMVYVAGSSSFAGLGALRFTNAADRIVIPDPAGVFNFRGAFTFEAVIATKSTANNAAILAKNGGGSGEGEYWWRAPGTTAGNQRLGVVDDLGHTYFLAGTNKVNDGLWHHLAVVVDPVEGQVTLYADYKLDAVTNGINLSGMIGWRTNLFIGSFVNGGSILAGDLAMVRITPSALVPAQFVQPSQGLPPTINPLFPVPGDLNVNPATTTLSAQILNRTTQVILSTVKLTLDDFLVASNVTVTATETGADLSWLLPATMPPGAHLVKISFKDNSVPQNSIEYVWPFTVPANLLVRGFWQFDEQIAGSAAATNVGKILDLSGNGRHFTAMGNPAPAYALASGDFGSFGAMRFTSGSDTVKSGAALSPAFNFYNTDSFTLEAVIRYEHNPANPIIAIVSKDYGSSLASWWFRLSNQHLQFIVSQQGGPDVATLGAASVGDGLWHHVAAVRNATNRVISLYVDYLLDAEGTDNTTGDQINGQDVCIGSFNATGREFEGDIDWVRICAAALSPDQFLKAGAPAPVYLFNLTTESGQVQFSFPTKAGVAYVVQARDSLSGASSSWVDLETVTGDGTVKTRGYPLQGGGRYFRVKGQ